MEDDDQQTTEGSAVSAASVKEARSQSIARRAQRRDEAERDARARERRREEALAAKAAARMARRANGMAAQSAQWSSFGSAQRLFTDGVALCLELLSLKDFNEAAQTCKDWWAGAQRVRQLGPQTVSAPVAARVASLRSSHFRALVTSLADSQYEPPDCNCSSCEGLMVTHSSPALFNALRCLSNLTSMDLPLDLAKLKGSATIRYPPRLSTAKLVLGCSEWIEDHAFDATSILRGLVACVSLTRLSWICSKFRLISHRSDR